MAVKICSLIFRATLTLVGSSVSVGFSNCLNRTVEGHFYVSCDAGFVLKRPLVTRVVIGVTKLWQLRELLDAGHVDLNEEVLTEIDAVHERYPNPTP